MLFKNNGTPFSVGDLFKIKGSNKFEQVVEPDKHVDSIGQLAKFFKDNQIIQRISAFNIIRTKELRRLAARKADAVQEAEEKGWSDKRLEARLAEIEEETKNEWKIGFDIDKVKSFGELKKYVKTASDFNIDVDESSEYSNIEESDPVHGNACAKRRVKLFEAAKKRGAEIFTTAEWTAAVCYNAAQTAPFGRVKPKVKPGTNEIDPACNLEDWETDADGNKITPENKKKRDDYKCVGSQTIKDGIDDGYGNSFNVINNTNMPAAKFAEAAWCVCGTEEKRVDWNSAGSQSFFNNYTNNGKRPIVVLMQNSRGAIYMYARFIGYGHSVIVNMLNEAGHVDGSSKTDTASQMKMYSGMCGQNRSFNDLMTRINTIYFPDTMPKNNKLADKQIKALQDDSAPSHKCAARRMKLFAAAEHYGATVGQTSDWVYAVCTKPDQIHPFGRNKPVVLPGTNEIDPACNLEDWETDADGNKITAANRAKRDDKTRTYPRVKDGITTGDGKSLDEHASHTGQSKKGVYNAEANWCVCGTLDGHYEWTYPNLKYGYPSYYDDMHPLIAFMEKSTGRMYLYANKGSEEFKNELDLVEVKTGNWLYGDFYKQHPSFAVLHKLLCSRYYQIGGDENASPEELYDKAFQTGMVTKNGFIKIKNRNEALKYQPIFDRFSGIYVDNEQAAEMFCGVDMRAVDVVDFTNVRSASRAFRQSNIGTIRIVGSGRVSDMGYMFEEA